ncbi:eukaryotic-like serine/threonine-protein kinase [Phycisphaerales bacterium]|nr:eukaryotic-like serine/threonine-protein kinase [Phycisphaerales bacterium]
MDRTAENLYDEYLEAAMAGEPPPPEEFLRERGVQDAALLSALNAVYGHASRERKGEENGEGLGGMPRRLGDFRLLRRLGEGGMGVVYLAEQVSLGRLVALKVIRSEVGASLTAAARFEREARAVARLRNPNIVGVHAVGEAKGVRYIAMEYIEGRGLDELLRRDGGGAVSVAPARVARWGMSLAWALHAAHAQGVVHRDVKPSNILITPDDRPMLLDFGLAREVGSSGATLTEAFVGSPQYAAPEQVGRSGQIDGRTDVYGLGGVMYEALTGRAPIDEGTLEQVLHAIVTEEPEPARRRNPSIPRDLSVVVMKALEKDPQRRYPSAASLAADLEAVLDFRAISARPPGGVERAVRWARRNRGATGAIATAGIAALAFGAAGVWTTTSAATQRRKVMETTIIQAEEQLRHFREARTEIREIEHRHSSLAYQRAAKFFTPEEDRFVQETEARLERSRKEREQSFYTALELAGRAEDLGADPHRVRRVRGELYLERYFEAEQAGELSAREMYARLARSNDVNGEVERALVGATSLRVESDPPGAEVHLFRRLLASEVYPDGEPRRVLVPFNQPSTPLRVDSWALRVVKGAGEVREGDIITALDGLPIRGLVVAIKGSGEVPAGSRLAQIDGGAVIEIYDAESLKSGPEAGERTFTFRAAEREVTVRARSLADAGIAIGDARAAAEAGGWRATVWSDGAVKETTLPPGLSVRTTAAPQFLGPGSLLGRTPLSDVSLSSGDYLVVIRKPGFEAERVGVNAVLGAGVPIKVSLRPEGEALPGWIHIHAPLGTDVASYWIMEREVTCRDYFEFLNQPETRAAVAASQEPILFPRDWETARGDKDARGLFTLPADWHWDWPVLFVSWYDAKAYAEWMTRRMQERGMRVTCDLPSTNEWAYASAGALGDRFLYGNRFRPKWASSCFARPRPEPEPVLRFPIDESVHGVFDLSGSASEWSCSLWMPDNGYFRHCGGSWGEGGPDQFGIYGGNGMLPDRVAGIVGFRLVMRPQETR